MLSIKSITRFVPLALLAGLLATGCASTSYIEVTYKLKAPEQDIGQKEVFLTVVDRRPETSIAGPNAKEELEYFTGLFSLYVKPDENAPRLIGAFDLVALFREAFKRRLESAGVVILEKMAAAKPVVEIQIKKFILDRDGKNWQAALAYEAATSKSGKVLTTQTVSGSAQRLKIVGTGDAEKLLGEIFSDMVNQLDPVKLFNHPEL